MYIYLSISLSISLSLSIYIYIYKHVSVAILAQVRNRSGSSHYGLSHRGGRGKLWEPAPRSSPTPSCNGYEIRHASGPVDGGGELVGSENAHHGEGDRAHGGGS